MTDRPPHHRLESRLPIHGRVRHHRTALAAAALFVLPAGATAAAPYYRIVEITPAVAGQEVWAWDLNNQGAVAGYVGRQDNTSPPSSTPKADFERIPRPGANVINKLALQRQFFCSGTI
jgi:hypothetical protein